MALLKKWHNQKQGNTMIEAEFKSKSYGKDQMPHITTHETELLGLKGRIAIQFAERWGMVAAIPDGEDSAGRQKLRMASSEEVSSRACDMVAAMFDEFDKRGWVAHLPTIAELKEKYPSLDKED